MATIGIDASALSTSTCGGIGTSQYRTMKALAEIGTSHDFVLYAATRPLVPFTDMPLDLPWPIRLGSGYPARSNILWMQTGVNRQISADRVDVFWGPRHLLPFRARGVRTVGTIHDFWDRYYPDQQSPLYRVTTRLLVDQVMRRADVVTAPSVATARDVERFGRRPPGTVRVVPWGVDTAMFRPLGPEAVAPVLARLGIHRPYILCLDVFNPRKNFRIVLEAVSRSSVGIEGSLDIVTLGRPGRTAGAAPLTEDVAAARLSERVRLVGDVVSQDVVALYSGALALVYPSVYEGFGLPLLEAMACDCPVVAGACPAMREVGGDAALFVDPGGAEEISTAIALLARDDAARARLVVAGRRRVEGFTWRRTAEGMIAAFEQALAAGGRGPS